MPNNEKAKKDKKENNRGIDDTQNKTTMIGETKR